MIYDLIIIGMGPGGMSAAIYAKRNGLNVLIIEKSMPGGLVNITSEVDNYLGFPDMVGPDLVGKFMEHINHLGITYKNKTVLEIKDMGATKRVVTNSEEFEAKKIIVATGRKPKALGLANEEELIGRGISRCALCDGMFYKGKRVAVIGAGNSALEETLHLANMAATVFLIHRRDELRGDKSLQNRIMETDNIEIIYNSQTTAINEKDGKLNSITLNDEKELEIDGLFIYVGYEPALDFANDLEKNPAGYLIVNDDFETNIKGIYAIGDIVSKKHYQIITAASEGAMAAVNASNAIRIEK